MSFLRPRPLLLTPFRTHTGYIAFEGRFGHRTDDDALARVQAKKLNLQPVKKITFKLDPFRKDVKGLRNMMMDVSHDKVRATNLKCAVKTEILSDGSEPTMIVDMNEGKRLVFRGAHLKRLDFLSQFNKIVLPLVQEKKGTVTETKASKLAKK